MSLYVSSQQHFSIKILPAFMEQCIFLFALFEQSGGVQKGQESKENLIVPILPPQTFILL